MRSRKHDGTDGPQRLHIWSVLPERNVHITHIYVVLLSSVLTDVYACMQLRPVCLKLDVTDWPQRLHVRSVLPERNIHITHIYAQLRVCLLSLNSLKSITTFTLHMHMHGSAHGWLGVYGVIAFIEFDCNTVITVDMHESVHLIYVLTWAYT